MNKRVIWWTLLILNLFSILFIFQIDLGLIPLFKTSLSETRTQRINSLVSNLSQGILVSTFFYFLLVFFQERARASTVRKLIQPRLDTITLMLGESIAYFVFKYNLNTTGDNFAGLTPDDFKVITRLTHEKMNFRYVVATEKTTSENSTGEVTELNHFVHEKKIVSLRIDEVFSLPTISSEEDELIEALSRLRDCWFYHGVDSFFKLGDKVEVWNFEQGVYDYYSYYRIISKYSDKYKVTVIRE